MDGLPRPPVWTRQSPPVLGARPAMPNGLATAFRVQMIVLGAIMMREIHTRFGRHHMGYLWLFFEPMILGGCIAVVHYVSGHGLPGGLDILSFTLSATRRITCSDRSSTVPQPRCCPTRRCSITAR